MHPLVFIGGGPVSSDPTSSAFSIRPSNGFEPLLPSTCASYVRKREERGESEGERERGRERVSKRGRRE